MDMNPFIPMLARHLGVEDQELLDQDVRLHGLLGALVGDVDLGPHLAFKGGTCLIKCYLDYPRFSTDLDFTWLADGATGRKRQGTQALRRRVRPAQRQLEVWFQELAYARGYRLEGRESFRYGQSNRMMTVSLRYDSSFTENGRVKVQLNFEEPLSFPTVSIQAKSLLRGTVPREFRLLEGDPASSYAAPIPVTAYDPREILLEKCRAILTRTAAKSRDLVDLFLLETRKGLRAEDYEAAIIAKTRYAAAGSSRYRSQASSFGERRALLLEEDVQPLLLRPIDMRAFRSFRERVVPFLSDLVPAILG